METFEDLKFFQEVLRGIQFISTSSDQRYGFSDAKELVNLIEAAIIDGADPDSFLTEMMVQQDCATIEDLVLSITDREDLIEPTTEEFLNIWENKLATRAYPRSLIDRLNSKK